MDQKHMPKSGNVQGEYRVLISSNNHHLSLPAQNHTDNIKNFVMS